VGIDHFCKAATAMPVVAMNAEIAINFIEMAEAMLGNNKKILTDSRPYFTSNIFKRRCENEGVELHIATPAHSEANGCCERFIRTFQQSLVKMGPNAINWHTLISPVINGYNNCTHSTTGYSPILCHYVNPIIGNPL
jgi:transposase InsO family protein